MEILIVCTGNLCRSPMAEVMLRRALDEAGLTEVTVHSSGTWAMFGNRATSEAVAAVGARGIALEEHRSRPLEIKELEAADVVLAMTAVHLREIEMLMPESAHKVRLLKELAELEVGDLIGSPEERLARLLAARRPPPRRNLDLDDPMGLPLSAYERCVAEIALGVDSLVGVLSAQADR